jgi:hypothetical protein
MPKFAVAFDSLDDVDTHIRRRGYSGNITILHVWVQGWAEHGPEEQVSEAYYIFALVFIMVLWCFREFSTRRVRL